MPNEFFTDEQEQAYGHYVGPRSTQQVSRYVQLDDAVRERVNQRRSAGNKLGFAVQSRQPTLSTPCGRSIRR